MWLDSHMRFLAVRLWMKELVPPSTHTLYALVVVLTHSSFPWRIPIAGFSLRGTS